jgi:hypothetical protein
MFWKIANKQNIVDDDWKTSVYIIYDDHRGRDGYDWKKRLLFVLVIE